jgi:hypothetical protein
MPPTEGLVQIFSVAIADWLVTIHRHLGGIRP